MRTMLVTLGVLTLLSVAPLVSAGPIDPVWDAVDNANPPQPANDEVEFARGAVESAMPADQNGLPRIDVPMAADDGWFGPIALAGLGAAAALGTVAFLFFGGARFVTPAEVLRNPVRQGIHKYLKNGVGANLKQLTDDLGLTTTNAIWHLRKLEDSGLIHSRRFNGYKVFYIAEGGIEARRMSLSVTALTNANAQEVFEYVMSHPGTHQREIARALTVNHGTVRWHLKKLMLAELIDETRRGKTSAYFATDNGIAALGHVVRAETATRPAPVLASSS